MVSAERRFTTGSIALISLLAFEAMAVATVMPTVVTELGGLSLYALAFGGPFAASVIGMTLAAPWADAGSARPALLTGVGAFVAGLVLCGTARDMAVLVAGRAVQGLGTGLCVVALYVLVGRLVPEPHRPKLFARFSAAWVVPAMVGPGISGLLARTLSWRAVFLLVPAVAVPAVALLWPALRGEPRPETRPDRPAVRGRLLLATAAGAGTAALQVAGSRPGAAWRAGAGLALVVVLACAVRLLPAGTFRLRRGLSSVIAVRGLVSAAFAGAETYLPLLLVREFGWPTTSAGLVLTSGAVSWAVGSWIQGRSESVPAHYRIGRIGTGLLLVGVFAVVATAVPGAPAWIAPAGWGIGAAGMGMIVATTSLLALHLAPENRRGEASSALSISDALSAALVLAVGGAFFAALLPRGVAPEASAGSAPYLAALGVAALAGLVASVAAARMAPTGSASGSPDHRAGEGGLADHGSRSAGGSSAARGDEPGEAA
jgi:MFS family permease